LRSRCREFGAAPAPGDCEGRAVLLQSNVGIALVVEAHEITVVDPVLLQEPNVAIAFALKKMK